MTVSRHRPSRVLAITILGAALSTLAACHSKEEITGSIYPKDYKDRHPIVIADRARMLDVFVEGPSGLMTRDRQDIGAFIAEYSQHGTGTMLAQVPAGHGTNPATRRAIEAIRAGARGRLTVSHYRPADPTVASPIRLSFKRLTARVGSKCGLWPDDIGVSDANHSWRNLEYYNFGCAFQANLASQVDDPRDLVRGRQETRADTVRRMYNFDQIRRGIDPSTQWKTGAASVTQGIGQ